MSNSPRRPQVCILGIAGPGTAAYKRAADAGALLAELKITVNTDDCRRPLP